jgi:divalent metal cation (Fe/Co/Zn/Cd) transporter
MTDDRVRAALLRRGFALEYVTLAWNVAGIVVLAIAAISARSVALAGFGLDSLIEIGASTVVIWELSGTGEERQRRGLRLIGYAFAALAAYLLVQSTVVLAGGYHPRHAVLGIIWTSVTMAVMFALAAGKARTGRALGNPVLRTEGRVTMIDAILAGAVLAGPGAERRPGVVVGRPGRWLRAGLLCGPRGPGDLLHRWLTLDQS